MTTGVPDPVVWIDKSFSRDHWAWPVYRSRDAGYRYIALWWREKKGPKQVKLTTMVEYCDSIGFYEEEENIAVKRERWKELIR